MHNDRLYQEYWSGWSWPNGKASDLDLQSLFTYS